jgi:hypothetical protein
MAIISLDNYYASARQQQNFTKIASRVSVAASWFSVFDLVGAPGAGVLAGANTANGIVPVAGGAGYPLITAFAGAAIGYLSRVKWRSSVACNLAIFDRVFFAGAYAFNAAVALTAQPSYAARIPNADFNGLEIWAETVTAATGNQAWNVTYTSQAGTAGRTTGATGIGSAPTVGRAFRLPLQAGDGGVQSIQNVAGTVGTVGTANIMVLRRLWSGRVGIPNDGGVDDFLRVGLPQLFATSALYMLIAPDGVATGITDADIEIASL